MILFLLAADADISRLVLSNNTEELELRSKIQRRLQTTIGAFFNKAIVRYESVKLDIFTYQVLCSFGKGHIIIS